MRFIALFVMSLVCFFSAHSQTLKESESTIVINEKSADLDFVIENSGRTFDSSIRIELLDKVGKVRSKISEKLKIKKGSKAYKFSLPLGDLMQLDADENLIWYRLRYKIGNTTGIVSLSELVIDNFELRVIATNNLFSGMTYRSRILAINPISKEVIKGVDINAELKLEIKGDKKQEVILNAKGLTDDRGFSVLDFTIPIETDFKRDAELNVHGRKKGLVRKASEELDMVEGDYGFLILNDKPIYQPEQELKVRGILLKGLDGTLVVADEEVEFKIQDEEDTVVYRETVKTSEFGIASISWKIPESAKLGDYVIRVKVVENFTNHYAGYRKIKVSRYDLPNFVVSPKPDKSFYLPNEEKAEVEVRADYLFGKPVTKGKVRIVEEESRDWNWKEQKYDIEEGQIHEGEIDSEGKFTAKFDLKEAHEDLADDSWRKFKDINLTAYFTDLTTNKTEQRRFDIRVTKEAIHLYLIGANQTLNPTLPINAYVSAFYADGSPAICDIEVKIRENYSEDEKYKTIRNIKTNAYGAGKFSFMPPKLVDDDDEDLAVFISAVDEKGQTGFFGSDDIDDEVTFEFDEDEDRLQIHTDRSIYKPGESVTVKINSNLETGLIFVDIIKGWSVIDSYFVDLKKGEAEINIPYQENFQGKLKVAVYTEDSEDEDEMIGTSKGIIFPNPQGLELDTKFDKESYKPGEEATVNFSVLDRVGNALESVLGIVIFDKAVEERAKTDGEFGGMFRDFSRTLGFGESFGSFNVKEINELDLSKPISDDLQLVAEVMFYDDYYSPNIFFSQNYETEASSVYSEFFKNQFGQIEKALKENYEKKNYEHPTDDASLAKILDENYLNFDALRDPWGEKYRAVFSVQETQDILKIKTSGADKTFGTKDDFIVSSSGFNYFTPIGKAIDAAILKYQASTGKFITDEETLYQLPEIGRLKDRFGNKYRIIFDFSRRKYEIKFRSLGKDGVYEKYHWRGDDFNAWTYTADYFIAIETKIANILLEQKEKPENEKEFVEILSKNGVEFKDLKDGYGNSIYMTTRQYSRYSDKVEIEDVKNFGEEKTTRRTKITPVTQEVMEFTLRSRGEDGIEGNYGDFTIAQFSFVIAEQTKDDEKPKIVNKKIAFSNSTGSIRGVVADATGAIIPHATVTAKNEDSQQSRTAQANENGKYLIANIVAGNYEIRASADGFAASSQRRVPVKAGSSVVVDFSLNPAGSTLTVDVTANVEAMDTTSSAVSESITINQTTALPKGLLQIDGARGTENIIEIDGKKFVQDEYGKLVPLSERSTPRLREYFPETLLWSPEIITDKNGKAEVKFKMADSITTWKVYTIASTKTGKVGVSEKEVAAFKSFFVDLEPPKFLTQGDEIFLPTQVRNYTNSKQKVDVTMAKADWFSFLDVQNSKAETRVLTSVQNSEAETHVITRVQNSEAETRVLTRVQNSQTNSQTKQIEVASGESENAVFGFKAEKFIKGGKQKVTAIAETDSDAIEKGVTVHPNGQEIVKTESKLFRQNAEFDVDFPANVIANTRKAEIKIYPNLLAHVAESVEGLLQRPYGCGEQTISSTYPNLMILKFTPEDNKLRPVASKFLQKGYERLLGYQVTSGGFSYWGGRDSADLALTAYAIRFLSDARSAINVDESVITRAEDWLIKQQRADGTWAKQYSWEKSENENRTKMLTSYIARTLALTKSENRDALQMALTYLKTKNAELDEPYTMALFGLASLETGNIADANNIAEKLSEMAIPEGSGVYWKLETNTPFYGWGKAGRIETTALVLQLLTKLGRPEAKVQTPAQDLISKGTQFLLKNKDRYGVWYSTQTTINVLDTFLATLSGGTDNRDQKQIRTADIFVNGQQIKTYNLPSADTLGNPITLDLSTHLATALNNRVEVKINDNSSIMSQVVQAHYIDWQDAKVSNRNTDRSRQIKLEYKCDRSNTKIMEEITCDVNAERVGFKGYGMLLAEIGIPPGADVSRESLENALKNDWSFSRYDVLPDRIIVYMWSKAGGTNFKFKFKPRYGINAQTPASFVYDYYNEEAKATVAPMRFVVE